MPDGGPAWPVQVGLSEQAAAALGLAPGDRFGPEDESVPQVDVRVSGIYSPDDPDDPAWDGRARAAQPGGRHSDGVERTSAAALVSPESLPDLRLAVPSDDLTQRIVFLPDPERLRWEQRRTCARTSSSSRPGPA